MSLCMCNCICMYVSVLLYIHTYININNIYWCYISALVLTSDMTTIMNTKTGRLKQQKLILSQFWRLKVQDQGALRIAFW